MRSEEEKIDALTYDLFVRVAAAMLADLALRADATGLQIAQLCKESAVLYVESQRYPTTDFMPQQGV